MSTLSSTLRVAILAALALGGAADAAERRNFDINSAVGKAAVAVDPTAARDLPAHADAIGRATFTWVQQPLPARAKALAGDTEAVARAHLTALLGRAKRDADAQRSLTDARIDALRGGAALVRLQPRVGGLPIFHEELALLLDADRRLVAMRGPLPREVPGQEKSLPAFALDAAQAVALALGDYGYAKSIAAQLGQGERTGEYRHFHLEGAKSAGGAEAGGTQRAKAVWFRTAAGLQPAWYVETQVAPVRGAAREYYAHVVSAVDGTLLFRASQTADAAYGYRVWAEPAPAGLPYPSPQGRANTPDPDGQPSNNPAPFVPQELRTLANVPFSRAATDEWLAAGANATRGNNADAYADRNEPDGFNGADTRPATTSAQTFDYAFTGTLAPTANPTQTHAATVQLFYWVNFLHDWFYDHGFAEVDGNAQASNYGRGGLEDDAINAEAQDYDTPDNATMSTPADGGKPRMQMGLRSTIPVTDFTLDGRTVAHEWGHYLSNRLIGDGAGLFTEHAGGMGEGWSDFIAQLVLVKEEDAGKPTNANYGGVYGGGYADHSYFGLRRYPLSTDVSKSPLTLRHIVDNVALPTAPPPQFGADGSDNSEVHNQGEIWASALWEAYAALLNDSGRLSFAQAQARMKDYLVAGLKLTPVAPTMVEARDALLAAVLASGDPADFALVTAAFAKRGLGAGAQIPDRYSGTMNGTVESTALGSDLSFGGGALGIATGCDADPVLDQGETAKLTLTIDNSGFAALPSGSLTLSASNPALSFPQGSTVPLGALPLFGSTTVSVPVTLSGSVPPNTPITITATPDAPGINSPPGAAGSFTVFTNFDESFGSSTSETFDGANTPWPVSRQPAGSGPATWSNRHDGTNKFLHGDDTGSDTVVWSETPGMATGAGPLVLTLRHRHNFEFGGGEAYDGGVIQVSTDGGATWQGLDTAVAGYGVLPLSDCCGNPLAGQRAYVGRSTGHPNFTTRTIDLGTAFANRSDFRLRFGVAVDAAVSKAGWDIDSLSIAGLASTPFATVAAQSASCSAAQAKTLQGAMSGTYYSTARSGEGVLVDFGKVGEQPVVFFSWYTYENGRQQWLVGSQPFALADRSVAIEVIETGGAQFGAAFQPQDVISTAWGSVSLTFPSCDTLVLNYQQNGGPAGTLTLQRGLERLAPGQCDTLHGGLSGTYYSPQRSGEGVLVDFGRAGGNPVEFFSWYTYEGGQQQWMVGSGGFQGGDASVSLDLIETGGAGFGNAFRSQDVQSVPWGRVTQRFVDCDTLELQYQKADGESGTLTLQRGLERLGDGVCR